MSFLKRKEQSPISVIAEILFIKSRYFLIETSLDMNVGVFGETSVGFLKSDVLKFFPKHSKSLLI